MYVFSSLKMRSITQYFYNFTRILVCVFRKGSLFVFDNSTCSDWTKYQNNLTVKVTIAMLEIAVKPEMFWFFF